MDPLTIENLNQIIKYAATAPSSHNTQPWEVSIDYPKLEILIGYNPQKQLKIGDPDLTELYISLGCFIETVMRAAGCLKYATKYTFVGAGPELVAKVKLQKSNRSDNPELLKAIINRRSDRRLYETRKLSPDAINALLAQSLEIQPAKMTLITSTKDIEFLASKTYDATIEAMGRSEFRDELSRWVRNNWTKQTDGMPAYTQGIPGPISLFAPKIIKNAKNVPVSQANKDSKRILRSAAIGIISTENDGLEGWIASGKMYQYVCLISELKSVKTSGISAAIIDPKTKMEIKQKFQIPGSPTALIRFGYKDGRVKSTPRRRLLS